ncbi:hypothetical protein PFICI_06986 [Pestalotiopsis fici W106-1]|uniref:Helix-turn-helix domain-containing protein n=1 Tax=Pestalotiopsis fici (strain W106-1 / CGMCC3.15140) TaxID=1229662 RepID=W3X7H7_PESFW|nr:uncharacterized protein PFICI_06986 [Pestalotiopsis fici W106-1]ETS81984.1 hypothetical protein PFICI_06986 [Pestalotiopsis fici W106-1]
MGSGASKTAQSTARKFPTRAPGGAAVPPSSRPAAPRAAAPPPASARVPKASTTKDEAITTDGGDPDHMTSPDFSQRLRQMGVATPNPTLSNSSIATPASPAQGVSAQGPRYPVASQNQTLTVLQARQRLEEQIELQQENPATGRNFADVGTLRQALVMKGLGVPNTDIEKRLRLRNGVVARIESGGVISPLN